MALTYAQEGGLGDAGGGVVDKSYFLNQGVVYTGYRPCFVWYRGDLYVIGYYSRPVVRHAGDGTWRLCGIRPPQLELVVGPGASSGGSAGACLAYITFLHKRGGVVLAESNPSNVVDVGDLSGEGRAWSNIDNASAELRVTHVRGYVSMDGAEFRAAWEAQYGVTAYAENIRTAQLTYAGPDFTNHIPPATRFGHSWAGRMWYANSPNYPYRVWYSKPGFPQYVKPSAFRDTLDRETITAIWKGRNELIVFCDRSTYMIRQFGQGEDDFVLEKLDSDVGCISHFGIQEVHNKLWFPSEDGIWIYDGGFRYLMKEVQPLWKSDWEAHKTQFKNGFALHDRINKTYMWVTRRPTPLQEFENTGLHPGTVIYCGYYGAYEPSMAGDQPHPEWTLDMRGRFDSCGFYNEDGELVIGSCDGVIRIQDWTDDDDDGDSLQKEAIIRSGHQLFFEPGDDWEFGKKLPQVWFYVESEQSDWTVYIRGGDEQVWQSELPDNLYAWWKVTVSASEEIETRRITLADGRTETTTLRHVPATTHFFLPHGVTGRGFTFELRAIAPVGLEYRGYGGMWEPGPGSTRPVVERTNFTVDLEWSEDGGNNWYAFPLAVYGSAGPSSPILIRATLTYNYGSPAYPISCRFVETTEGYEETVAIPTAPDEATAGLNPDPPNTEEWIFTIPSVSTVKVFVEDANGILGESDTETLTFQVV